MSDDQRPWAIFLMGPTASGKTDLAVRLVNKLPFEIVSVDSAMVYRGMDIGTAKPGQEVLSVAPHRLINILDPSETYSAACFREDALREMEAITKRRRIPLLVGGTMLYFRALEQGLAALPNADPEVRRDLENQARECGWPAMHQRLVRRDPEAANRIHPNDPQRIQRALEVIELTGRSMSELFAESAPTRFPYRILKVVLLPSDRSVLNARIARRTRHMIDSGFLDEVRQLFARPDLHANLPAMRAVGYRQAWEHLAGHLGVSEWEEATLVATRQYAKRQLTWLRGETEFCGFDCLESDVAKRVLELIGAKIPLWD